MSFIAPAIGWYSYFNMCSFCVVSHILIFPDTSVETGERERMREAPQHPTSRGNVEATGGVGRHSRLHRVLSVHVCHPWVLGKNTSFSHLETGGTIFNWFPENDIY